MSAVKPARHLTLRDMANRLRVNPSTVSRALRNDPQISPGLRQRIQQLARDMNYSPDPMLSALAQYRRGRATTPIRAELAWINARPNPCELRSFREFELYWQGATESAREAGYRLEEFRMGEDIPPARLESILRARNILGILIPPHNTTPAWEHFNWDRFSVVRFGYSCTTPRAHIVTSDQLTDGLLAFESMTERGYRNIGLVAQRWTTTRFSAGYLHAQMTLHGKLSIPPLLLGADKKALSRSRLLAWMKRYRPDAILTATPDIPEWLQDIGYRVPDDVGVATLTIADTHIDAGIDQNSFEIGRAAVQLLISLIQHHERGIPAICREVLVEGRWVDGKSLPRR